MDLDLDDRLVAECPNLYRDRHASAQVTCMCWGFEFGNGWFELIYDLSVNLEKLILELPEEERADCKASQVKEKFGGLRFHMDSSTEEMRKLIREAENLSFHICEICGSKGQRRAGGWIQTLCDHHAEGKKGIEPPKPISLKELRVMLQEKKDNGST